MKNYFKKGVVMCTKSSDYSQLTEDELIIEIKNLREYKQDIEFSLNTNKRALESVNLKIHKAEDALNNKQQLKLF